MLPFEDRFPYQTAFYQLNLLATLTGIANAALRDVGGKVLVISPSVGGAKEASDYIKLFDYDINLLASTLKQVLGR